MDKSVCKRVFKMKHSILLAVVILSYVSTLNSVHGANILFFWGVSGYSHRLSAWPLIEKLTQLGHKITFISPYASKVPSLNPNITDIVPTNLAEDVGLINIDFITMRLKGGVEAVDELWYEYYLSGIRGCESMMQNPQVIDWIQNATFDLVILDALYNECGYGLIYKWKVPHMMYTPTAHFQWWKESYGYPDENFPEMENHYRLDMSFFQSVKNLLNSLYWQWMRSYQLFPKLEALLRDKLNIPDLPSLHEIEKNTSIIFTNTHFSEEYPRSLPPNFVEIGGIHCRDERKPLPKDIEEFLKSSGDEGFIYLSFGTYASLANLPKYLQDTFFDAMRQVNRKFVVKYDREPPKDLPKNVKTVQWISQQDILAHPNIKLYIGHGGLLGTQEAIYHEVPMIIIPLFAEQDYNSVRAHARETAISLEISELTQAKLVEAIWEVLNNKKYKENTKKLSMRFKDRPAKPLDTAVWWIEFVLRHNGDTAYLRPVGINKNWFERRMLHIWGFLALLAITAVVLLGWVFYIITNKTVSSASFKSKSD